MGDEAKANGNAPSLFAKAIVALEKVKEKKGDGEIIVTEHLLSACKEVLPIVDVFGAALGIVKKDIGGNIERLEKGLEKDPEKFRDVYEFVRVEIAAGNAESIYSCTQALLWLTRAMDFLLGLLKKMEEDKECSVKEAADFSYNNSLSAYHGWIARSAFTVAMQFCPSRESFYTKLGSGYSPEDLMMLLSKVEPVLKENHEFLESVGYNQLKAL